MKNILLLFVISFLLFSCSSKTSVDLIVHNGIVYTVDSGFSTAQAFAVKDGKIVEVGSNEAILNNYEAKEKVDAGGKAVYPGFIDAHAHFISYGQSLFSVDLYDSKSFDEVLERVKKFAAEHPSETWIRGRGWDQNKFPGKSFPTNDSLNKYFPDKPVLLERVDGHAYVANAKALEIANVHPGQTINGGSFETFNGRLTGILVDNAGDVIASKIPYPSKEEMERWLMAAQKNCFEQGLTTITECGISYRAVDLLDTLQKEGKLDMRLYIMLSDDKVNYDKYLSKGPYKTDKLFVKGFKVYADGALGSRGACLLQPYSDRPNWHGFLLNTKSHYDSVAALLANTDFQMCTHAIGDSANREILNVYNKYLKGKNDKRWRIEHAQIINQNDFNLFGNASIIPSVQPTHATSDMYWAGERLGTERLKGGYALKQLLQQNGWLPLGTDFPVEDISPFKTFLAAVFRKDAKSYPAGGFQMENALSREETIRGMTIWAAKADFMENEIGSIETGKKADFIILDNDLMKVNETDVLNTKVISTYSNGKKVFGK
ncbi:amidohydrolase [Panacibacter ginsenosidivorans]|uniref:Amidohydrolase n=1 Tax=Panacibacter ginsenosidivorans TaxID=1813871 RepID=A0A5B8V8A2_9BACT|nr:amidohydrolase [Panacibacter ginsenosidivorans]QEC67634.1 amidohydrolase [Panacibacter ginsenosidivorans]